MSLKELTDFYTKAFMEDLDALNIQRAEHYPRATEFIDEIVAAIESLIKKGYAYRAEDGSVYFSIKKFPTYGRLSGIKQAEVKAGTRVAVDHYEKMGANDFALWKAWDPDDGAVFWETPPGQREARLAHRVLRHGDEVPGTSLDIHTGGKDLKFPHHENEIAQSEALTGKRFVKLWLHSEFLYIKGEKMSKSLGNFVTLRDLLKQGLEPPSHQALPDQRALQRRAEPHRRLHGAGRRRPYKKIDEFFERLQRGNKTAAKGKAVLSARPVKSLLADFDRAMDDDLNTPKALAVSLQLPTEGQRIDRLRDDFHKATTSSS